MLQIVKAVLSKRFFKYAVVGLMALLADYTTFIILHYILDANLAAAVILSQFTGLVVSFVLNRAWVFTSQVNRAIKYQILKFLLLFIFNTAYTYLVVRYLSGVGVEEYLAKAFAIVCIIMWNYVLYKKIF